MLPPAPGRFFDDELLTEPLRQPLTDQACHDVECAGRSKRGDDAHRPRRIGLRPSEARHSRKRGSAGCEMQELATGKFHFEPPFTVAVGTRISSRAPRTEPYVRLSRIRLPPRVCDGKASARPRMEDDWFREPRVHQLRHLCPRDPIPLASTP